MEWQMSAVTCPLAPAAIRSCPWSQDRWSPYFPSFWRIGWDWMKTDRRSVFIRSPHRVERGSNRSISAQWAETDLSSTCSVGISRSIPPPPAEQSGVHWADRPRARTLQCLSDLFCLAQTTVKWEERICICCEGQHTSLYKYWLSYEEGKRKPGKPLEIMGPHTALPDSSPPNPHCFDLSDSNTKINMLGSHTEPLECQYPVQTTPLNICRHHCPLSSSSAAGERGLFTHFWEQAKKSSEPWLPKM